MRRLFFIFILSASTHSAIAQQDALYSQYMFNKLLVNPGYAGSKEVLSIDILDRYQWVGIEGAPRTFTIAAHSSMRNRKVGLGMYAYKDQIGPIENKGMMGTYSYRIFFKESVLSFGVQAGFKFFDIEWLDAYISEPDPLFTFADIQRVSPDANLGIYYYTPTYFLGISSKQLFQNEYGTVMVNGRSTYTRLSRHFYAMGGTAYELSPFLALRTSMLMKYVAAAPVQVDVNLSVVFADQFWVGFSYRTEKALIFLTEFRLLPYMRVGYSFDYYFNEIATQNKGTHEIRLGLDFELFQSRMLTPRYFF
jgi:type IX secretion system PorP/SprF family membrane protein